MVFELQFSQPMRSHEPALVDVSVYAVDMPFTGILPCEDVAFVDEFRLTLGVLRNHKLVAVEFSYEIAIVEICTRIDKWLLFVGFFHEVEKFQKRVAKGLCF